MKGDEGTLGRSGLPGGIVRFSLLYAYMVDITWYIVILLHVNCLKLSLCGLGRCGRNG